VKRSLHKCSSTPRHIGHNQWPNWRGAGVRSDPWQTNL